MVRSDWEVQACTYILCGLRRKCRRIMTFVSGGNGKGSPFSFSILCRLCPVRKSSQVDRMEGRTSSSFAHPVPFEQAQSQVVVLFDVQSFDVV